MNIGAPFNPYRVFQGAFAPYWLLEHRGISTGAKLCYIRLLGFAGKDARCYPSLETLGASLGVSERQARDYVKKLERTGLIVVEQRGLRKTNVYLFVWTAELERLSNSVPGCGEDPDESGGGTPPGSPPDRNNRSGQDRNHASAPERNSSSGPIGINSDGISSLESSSSSSADEVAKPTKKMTALGRSMPSVSPVTPEKEHGEAQTISRWAQERGIQRLRTDRRMGPPEKDHLQQWAGILNRRSIAEPEIIFAVLDSALTAADRLGEWRNWTFLTLQIQLAAERLPSGACLRQTTSPPACAVVKDNPSCDWAIAKAKIRTQVGEIPFLNWFEPTRQVEREGAEITIAVPDEPSRIYLEAEYGNLARTVLAEFGIHQIHLTVAEPESLSTR
jgi:Helix-turn-helix domain